MINISVIIPTFNRANTISRAIESVLKQSYPAQELIIVDDGSTDATKDIVEQFRCPQTDIKYIKQSNHGVSHARNQAINLAKSEWIALLDSDDEWLPEKLQEQVNFIHNNPSIKTVHGEEIWIRNGKRVNQKKKHQKSGGDIFIPSLSLCLMSPSSILIHQSIFEEVGAFDEEFTVCEDYDLWLRVTAQHEVGFIDTPIIKKYGGHEDQLSRKFKAMDYWRVKSMYRLLKDKSLNKVQAEALIPILLEKSEILLRGYTKHQNWENYDEVKEISQSVKSLSE